MSHRGTVRVAQVVFACLVALSALAGDSSKPFQPCKGQSELGFRDRQKAMMMAIKIGTTCGPILLKQAAGIADMFSGSGGGPNLIDLAPPVLKFFCFGQQLLFGALADEKNILYKNVTRGVLYEYSIKVIDKIGAAYPAMKVHSGHRVFKIPGTVILNNMKALADCYNNNTNLPFIKDLRYVLFIGENMQKTLQ